MKKYKRLILDKAETIMMKKAILEEHDTRKLSLIQGPSIIINRLIQLQFAYDKYLDETFWEMDGDPIQQKNLFGISMTLY